jgi:hypothetical protein
MQPTKLEDRPPYVTFETRSIEDREATIQEGHYVGRDVDYAIITPAGSKDRIERVVSEWFTQLEENVRAERVPAEWVKHFRSVYDDFKAGREAVLNGTSILDWPGLSPSQVKTLQSLRLMTIEDVSVMNEESISRLGMGGRALKQRAVDYLAAANNVGKVAEVASALRVQTETLEERNRQLEEQNRLLKAQLEAMQSGGQAFHAPAASPSEEISADDLGLGAKL